MVYSDGKGARITARGARRDACKSPKFYADRRP